MHLNITSIPKYIDQLRVYLANKPVDILSINETRLTILLIMERSILKDQGIIFIAKMDVNLEVVSLFMPETF